MDNQVEIDKVTDILQEMDDLLQNVKTTLKDLVEKCELDRQILEIKIRGLGNGCPFDPIAKCNLAPGISCAEIDCPVWLESINNG